MSLPQKYTAKVLAKEQVCWKVTKVTLEFIAPTELVFEPGQFVSLQVDPTNFRAYSICSDYKTTNSLELAIETGHEGKGSNYTKNLQVGDTVTFIGPSGRYKLKTPLPQNIFFLATGTGIAPFIPMLHKLADDHYAGKVTLLQGFRNDEDAFFTDVFEFFKPKLTNYTYSVYISQQTTNPKYKKGRINTDLSPIIVPDSHYYICGHPAMVAETKQMLVDKGVVAENILTEEFTHSNK